MSKKFGKVKWFNAPKGFGFIVNEEGQDVFVHHRAILHDGYRTLNEGEEVEYLEVKSEKGLQAAEVVSVETI